MLTVACADASHMSDGAPAEPTLVAIVRQYGPVGYRDPIGVLSPDGRWLATAAQQVLAVRSMPEGEPRELEAGTGRIGVLRWTGDGALAVAQAGGSTTWWRYDTATWTRAPLWPAGAVIGDATAARTTRADRFADFAWSRDGGLAAIEPAGESTRIWTIDAATLAGTSVAFPGRLTLPHFLADGRLACLAFRDGHQRITLPCGEGVLAGAEAAEAFGPIATSPDGALLYAGIANERGFVDLWEWRIADGTGRLIASLERDTYAPSIADDGTVLFRRQEYDTKVAVMRAGGGATTVRAAFQSETPSWDWTGAWLGITYGTWRRQADDFRYPDIAQDAGIIASEGAAPATVPDRIVQESPSEDQGMTWSPNGKWIAFHSHQQQSDDIWMRIADNSSPAFRATNLGRGAETGWPRWSPDGKWIVFDGDTLNGALARSMLWVIGVDQESGRVTRPLRAIPLADLTEDVLHAEWKGGSERIVFSTSDEAGTHALHEVGMDGGTPRLLYRWRTTQRYDGFGVSPDGSAAVIVQPAADGRMQLFRVALDGAGSPVQLTTDPTDKTQPSWSPDGGRIAFTIWSYESRFYTIRP